jgi:2-C-methyl-D-erythritol 2,4-cyclodiphosphate synthase
MLEEAVRRVRKNGYRVAQADVTIITESPRLIEYRAAMCSCLAGALGLQASEVSVKAKTNEGLGWIGRGEGIACIAVATLDAA